MPISSDLDRVIFHVDALLKFVCKMSTKPFWLPMAHFRVMFGVRFRVPKIGVGLGFGLGWVWG